ncbi:MULTISPECIES: ParA family protein [unclassified Candidatus Frackibacter]|uniref:ParA family protein n=1 Tax=unclassified Candidatus Frackibacter TaxID=2648818 RepID=UPI0008860D8E|nr:MULTISPECIES: ParA family protein [unclassified Candidatus Frackibacter]SDC18142.1 chromosome partitioning protein [Candidatus Frackibacter sp. WG11]SEM43997.1 chromosome partitioning protein [Candidatus Frackibacter sp. WG12]SFL46455.1 chromosome partitioning protein [Candidatus Frackibacter sp. WG13]
MGQIFVIGNQKGGVGKTTTSLNLGAALTEFGKDILLIDLDPQGGLTLHCGYEPDKLELSIYDALKDEDLTNDALLETKFGAHLLPANVDLAVSEMELINSVARERRLTAILNPIRDNYDLVIIDGQPSLGLLTLNAMTAANQVIIPIACEYLALRGVDGLMKMIKKVQGQLNSKLKINGVVPTMFDRRTNHTEAVLKQIKKTFEPEIKVYDHIIYRSIRFAEAAERQKAIIYYAKNIPGAAAYRDLARELIRAGEV